ncbi:MAG: hypothetical protein [Microviridae sp.]|nr:MAG: hypothetical protein [Microviridae sp.]
MQTSKKMSEQLHTQLNTNETIKENSLPLIEREQIPGTPYWIIGNEEQGYFLQFGKYKLTENYSEKEYVKKHLIDNQFNIMLQTCLAVVNEAQQNTEKSIHNLNTIK